MTKPRRRQAGEGGISQYPTKAGPRFLIKYTATLEDGSTKVVLRRGFPTRKAAAEGLGDINVEIRQGRHVLPSNKTVGRWDGKPGQGLKSRTIRYVHTTSMRLWMRRSLRAFWRSTRQGRLNRRRRGKQRPRDPPV
jgi:hypothetical protein